MGPVFRKLNLKQQDEVVVVGAPTSFEDEIATLGDVRVVRDLAGVARFGFLLAFVTRQDEVDALADAAAERADGDAVLWFAYPKKSSKRYRSEIHRDHGWDRLGAAGFEPVRQVAIDEDWSALRFRRVEHIGQMTREPKRALSAQGKARVSS